MEQELSTNLTTADLKVIMQLIEACSVRGVFKANELAVVGEVYNKITACLVNINSDKNQRNQEAGS